MNEPDCRAVFDGWLRLKGAARFLAIPRQTFSDAVERGEVPFIEIDGVRFFGKADLILYHNTKEAA